MAGIGTGEIIAILIIALLIFGPRKLPELGKSLGTGLREFRRNTKGLKEEFDLSLKADDQEDKRQESQVAVSTLAQTSKSDVEESHRQNNRQENRQKIRPEDAIAKPTGTVVGTEKIGTEKS